ncbi:MAG: hypothetical protein DMF72_02735 [Acidobacteria bacterium]|nr:MAG: hypothetical protein DMF72_02735 [Acidobacteriota bacterium]
MRVAAFFVSKHGKKRASVCKRFEIECVGGAEGLGFSLSYRTGSIDEDQSLTSSNHKIIGNVEA